MTGRDRRFMCDEMLIRLAHWLRAAGYDTATLASGASDRALMDCARADGRLILTRDQKFMERRGARSLVFLIFSTEINEQAREITGPLGIDWLKTPFSRCLVDNSLVRPATREEIATLAFPSHAVTGPFTTCDTCGRLYWIGSHARRMRLRLESWSQT